MYNLVQPQGGWQEDVACSNKCTLTTTKGPGANQLTFTVSPKKKQSLAPGSYWQITYTAKIKAPTGTTATIFRFKNQAQIQASSGTYQGGWLATQSLIAFRYLPVPVLEER